MKTKCPVPLFQSIDPILSSATNINLLHPYDYAQSITYLCSLQSLT